ncbi:MAG: S1 RNA-binding domain-containing protein [Anaerolineaceae bacterium]
MEDKQLSRLSGPEEAPDDSWWESIISEEDRYGNPKPESPSVINKKCVRPPKQQGSDWDQIQKFCESEQIITVAVTGYNHGGVLVKGNGVDGFIPSSHLVRIPLGEQQNEKRRVLAGLLGKRLSVKVIECDPAHERVVLSERAAQVDEGSRKNLLESLNPGDRVIGIVTNITSFGVFIDLGGLEGLVHVSELSWGRVGNPGDLLKIGQQVELMVMQISTEKSRVALSLKQLYPNPWEDLAQKCKPGDIVPAMITHITAFGAFAQLEEFGVEGLIHQTSLHLTDSSPDLHEVFYVNQPVNVIILQIDSIKRRLGLNLVK